MSNKIKKNKVSRKNSEKVQLPYEITYDAIEDQKVAKLPQNIQDEINAFAVSNRKEAASAIERLLELRQEYSKIPILYNYISVTYGFIDQEKQNQAIEDNYLQNPNYIFARCHYAQLCMQRGELDKVLPVFDNKLDLKSLYPRRALFHITEYTALTGVLCEYFYKLGDMERAEVMYQGLQRMMPDAAESKSAKLYMEPGVFTRIKRKLIAALVK